MIKVLRQPVYGLFMLTSLEILFLTYAQNMFGYILSPLVLLFVSLSIAILPLFFFNQLDIQKQTLTIQRSDRFTLLAVCLFLLIIFVMMFVPRGGLLKLYQGFPGDKQYSDIIPTIQVMCKRLLSGQNIYVSIEEFGYHLPTTYLPMMWIPYSIAEFIVFDYRWITFLIFVFTILLTILLFVHHNRNNVLPVFLYLFFFFSLLENKSDVLGWTVEIMNGAYYTLFVIAILSGNKYFKAIALSVCLMSRYSLVLYLPVYFIAEWQNKGFRTSFNIGAIAVTITAAFLLILVQNNWTELFQGFNYYSTSGLGEWRHLDDKGLPIHICNGNGFAAWVYFLKNGSLEEKFLLTRKLHFLIMIVVSFMLLLLYFFLRQRIPFVILMICIFKIYLTFFYGFIQVPYTYLFVVPVMVSIIQVFIVNSFYVQVVPANNTRK